MIKENKMKDKNLLAWDEILKPGTPFWTISFYPEEKQIKCPVCGGDIKVVYAYEALGNAINVDIVKIIAKKMLSYE